MCNFLVYILAIYERLPTHIQCVVIPSFPVYSTVNNHFQSVLFAGVLMRDETASSFKWVFNEFLTLMSGKAPMTIFTGEVLGICKITVLIHMF